MFATTADLVQRVAAYADDQLNPAKQLGRRYASGSAPASAALWTQQVQQQVQPEGQSAKQPGCFSLKRMQPCLCFFGASRHPAAFRL